MKKILLAGFALSFLVGTTTVSADGGMMSTTDYSQPVAVTTTQPTLSTGEYNALVNTIVVSVLELFEWKNDQGEITFSESNFGANYGCNSIGGSYEVDMMDVEFSEAFMTKMACEEDVMDAEMEFVENLSNVRTLTFADGKLVMTGLNTSLSFTASLPDAE